LTTLTEAAAATVPAVVTAPAQSAAETPAPSQEATNLAAANDQTVLIPAPPTASETVVIPDDRSPRVYGGSNDESRIVIRALQDSWVQVRDPQDAILLTRVLRAGDSYRVPNVTGLTLLTGNAGGIELEVDGVRLPPAGPPGSVRRSIALDPAQLLSGTANR
jgi:cytoskeleton protein RodZ